MLAHPWKIVRSAAISAVIVLVVFGGRAAAETEARCRDILQQALADKNPETRKHAVVALEPRGWAVPPSSQVNVAG
jgi:hypothetical protein